MLVQQRAGCVSVGCGSFSTSGEPAELFCLVWFCSTKKGGWSRWRDPEGARDRQAYRCRVSSDAFAVPVCLGKALLVFYVPALTYGHLQIADTSDRNEFPPLGGWAHLEGHGEELSHPRGAWSRATAPLHQEVPLWRGTRHVQACPTGRRHLGRPTKRWRDDVF